MRHFLSFALQCAVAGFIVIQRDVDNVPLVAGYDGLMIAFAIAVAGALWSLASAARVTLVMEH